MTFLPQNLRYLRRKIGKSQFEISKLVEKKQNTIGNWENDVSEPTITELAKLAQFFGVSLQDIIMKDLSVDPIQKPQESVEPFKPKDSVLNKPTQHTYGDNESFISMAREASQHQFWVLIGELRRIHEKLDVIKTQLDGKLPEKIVSPRSGL